MTRFSGVRHELTVLRAAHGDEAVRDVLEAMGETVPGARVGEDLAGGMWMDLPFLEGHKLGQLVQANVHRPGRVSFDRPAD